MASDCRRSERAAPSTSTSSPRPSSNASTWSPAVPRRCTGPTPCRAWSTSSPRKTSAVCKSTSTPRNTARAMAWCRTRPSPQAASLPTIAGRPSFRSATPSATKCCRATVRTRTTTSLPPTATATPAPGTNIPPISLIRASWWLEQRRRHARLAALRNGWLLDALLHAGWAAGLERRARSVPRQLVVQLQPVQLLPGSAGALVGLRLG